MSNNQVNTSEKAKLFFDYIIAPLAITLGAYFVFNQFFKDAFVIDDIDYLTHLKIGGEKFFAFIQIMGMRSFAFKPFSLGVCWFTTFKLFGLNPYGYHIFNFVIHVINSYLIFIFMLFVFKQRRLGFIAGFAYAVHPYSFLHHMWITAGFTAQTSVLFSLLTMIMYCLYLQTSNRDQLILSYFTFYLACLSREDTFLLPLLIIVYLLLFDGINRERIKEISIYLIIILCIMNLRVFSLYPHVFGLYQWSFFDLKNAAFKCWYYFDLTFSHLKNLFMEIGFLKKYPLGLILVKTMLGLIFPAFAVYKACRNIRSGNFKLFSFGLIWFFLLSTTFIFMTGIFKNERYLSLSIIGILIVQAMIIIYCAQLIAKNSAPLLNVLLFLAVILIFLTSSYKITTLVANFPYRLVSDSNKINIARIEAGVKNNPRINTVKLLGFDKLWRFAEVMRLDPRYNNMKFIYIQKDQ